MRVASRVIGIVLALAGLIFVSFSILFLLQFRPQSVLAGPRFGRPAWTGAAFAAVLGVGLLLAGWYYFTLDLDALDDIEERPASRFALYLIAHGSELKLIALVGFHDFSDPLGSSLLRSRLARAMGELGTAADMGGTTGHPREGRGA
jgi:hypothetical protein